MHSFIEVGIVIHDEGVLAPELGDDFLNTALAFGGLRGQGIDAQAHHQ